LDGKKHKPQSRLGRIAFEDVNHTAIPPTYRLRNVSAGDFTKLRGKIAKGSTIRVPREKMRVLGGVSRGSTILLMDEQD